MEVVLVYQLIKEMPDQIENDDLMDESKRSSQTKEHKKHTLSTK
jgi:hypothetical protein